MAEDNDSLLREVDEELRREQMQKLWERYNGLILGVAALIVLAVGGYKFLEARRITAAQTAGAEFSKALDLGEAAKSAESIAAFEKLAASGPAGYAALSRLHLAGAHAKAGKIDDAIAAYQAVVNDSAADSLLKNFAQLQIATLKVGDADFTAQENRLKPLIAEESAFKITARELLGLSAFKAGKFDEARKSFEPLLIDPKASRAIQERVKIVMGQIARAETAKGEPAKPAAPAAAPAAPAEVKSDAKPAAPDKK